MNSKERINGMITYIIVAVVSFFIGMIVGVGMLALLSANNVPDEL